MERLAGLLGLGVFFLIAWLISEHKKQIPWKILGWGVVLQFGLALLVLGIPAWGWRGPLRPVFDWANELIVNLLNYTLEGSRFVFGGLVDSQHYGFIFAFQVLPTIIFVAALMAVLYHWKVMQRIVLGMAWLMQRTMGTSGAESLAAAANVFVGQTEAPLVVRPYIAGMTRSELLSLMIGGMATVAGGVLAAYVGLLKDRIPEIAGHLLTASLMSAPAALAIAKMIIPETKKSLTFGGVPDLSNEIKYTNTIEAAAVGAGDGLKLALNVGAMLLAFIALLALANSVFGSVGDWIHFSSWGTDLVPSALASESPRLSLQLILGWIFAPLAWLMGIPWSESALAGALLGEKVVLNEFVAYLHLSEFQGEISERTLVILSYALCGFANFSSIAIQIGGIGELAPSRKSELAALGIKAVIGGSLAAFMTAAIAGILI